MAAISDFFDGMHGVVFPFGGMTAPSGFLMCDGTAVSRTTYAALFAVMTISTTGNTATNSMSVTSVVSTVGLSVGMPISGPGIQAGTTISAIGSGTLTLSKTATATASGVSLVVAPHGVGDGSTTFNVPDLRGRVPAGHDAIGGTAAGRLPNWVPGTSGGAANAASDTGEGWSGQYWSGAGAYDGMIAGYHSHTTSVVQPTIAMNYIIKT